LRILDAASICLNSDTYESSQGTRLTHPVAELTRILICLNHNTWPLSSDIGYRIQMIVKLLIRSTIPTTDRLLLRHGDMNRKNMIWHAEKLTLIDTEHSTLAVGDIDLAAFLAFDMDRGAGALDCLRELRKLRQQPADFKATVQWLLYFLVRSFLLKLHQGQITIPTLRLRRVLTDLTLGLQ
jgi:hypothetical protein